MKKFLGSFLILVFVQSFVDAVPSKIKITVGGIKDGGVMWAKTFKWTLPDFDSWQEFSAGLWGQVELGLVDPEILQEKSYIQKTSDYFSEFCHQSYPAIFYAKEKALEDVPLQCDESYSFQDGREWQDVSLRKLSVNGEGNLFTEWMVGFKGS